MVHSLILAALFVGSLATYTGGGSYGGGGYGGYGGYGGGGWDNSNKIKGDGGKNEVVEISIHIISESPGGSAPTNDIAPPMKPPGATHKVAVGGAAGLIYSPDTIIAEIGDIVQFNFLSKNHTATQSTFPLPCVKMEGGQDSGFKPNLDNTMNPPPSWSFQVMTKKPLWFYCRQKGHCGMGMTFSINPTPDKSQATFKQMAIAQNGTAGDAPPASAPPYSSSVVVTSPASSVPPVTSAPPASTELPVIVPPPPTNNNQSPPGSMVSGSGSGGSGTCECSCFCGVAAFPPGVGLGNWGGLPGSVPASW